MISPNQTQFLLIALRTAAGAAVNKAQGEIGRAKLRTLEAEYFHKEQMRGMELAHERQMFGMKAELMRALISALVEQRVDAVRQGFVEALSVYAEQCRHYMAQQDRYADAEIKATDPLERANLRTRLTEIDLNLGKIRADVAKLYREMTNVILLIGGNMPQIAGNDQQALRLTNP